MTTKILAVYLFFDGAMLEIYYGSKLSVMTGRFDLQSGAATRKVLYKSCCCEFCEISKKTFFQRTRPKAASAAKLLHTMKLRICNTRIHFVRTKLTSNLTQRSLKTTEAWNFGQSWNISKQKKTYLSIVIVDYNFCCLRTLDYLHMINILLSYIQVD